MSRRSILIAAVVTAAAVFLIGFVYTLARERSYESVATVVLSPSAVEPDNVSSLLESFERSGTLGTYVEMMASEEITAKAQEMGVSISVRAVPDTRAIRVIGKGSEESVQPAVESVITATRDKKTALSDLYVLEVLGRPSAPSPAPPSTTLLLMATVLLSIFAGVGAFAILSKVAPTARVPVRRKPSRSATTPSRR